MCQGIHYKNLNSGKNAGFGKSLVVSNLLHKESPAQRLAAE
jgi:hypothetical protein